MGAPGARLRGAAGGGLLLVPPPLPGAGGAERAGALLGLARIGEALAELEAAGIPPERTILLGFSQGACLSLEFAARNARRYGGIVGLSGAVTGPPGSVRSYAGSLAGTPVFLGCSDRDPHIPRASVDETAEVLRALGAEVTERIYPALGHTVNQDEMAFVRELIAGAAGSFPSGRSV